MPTIPGPSRSDPKGPQRLLKVRVPQKQHMRLHAHRMLSGKSLSEIVEAALKDYLAEAVDAKELERAKQQLLSQSADGRAPPTRDARGRFTTSSDPS